MTPHIDRAHYEYWFVQWPWEVIFILDVKNTLQITHQPTRSSKSQVQFLKDNTFSSQNPNLNYAYHCQKFYAPPNQFRRDITIMHTSPATRTPNDPHAPPAYTKLSIRIVTHYHTTYHFSLLLKPDNSCMSVTLPITLIITTSQPVTTYEIKLYRKLTIAWLT